MDMEMTWQKWAHMEDCGIGNWWSSEGFTGYGYFVLVVDHQTVAESTLNYAANGKSVRCVRDP